MMIVEVQISNSKKRNSQKKTDIITTDTLKIHPFPVFVKNDANMQWIQF